MAGDPQARLDNAGSHESNYNACRRKFDYIAAQYYDCKCAAEQNPPNSDLSKCVSDYAFLEGKHKAFSHVIIYKREIWSSKKSVEEQIDFIETVASCAAEKYKSFFVKTVARNVRKSGLAFRQMLSRGIPQCLKKF